MTPSDRTPTSDDDLFSSLLESLSTPDQRAPEDTSYFAGPRPTPAPRPSGGESLEQIDDALFPSLVIDLSSSEPRAEIPTDVGRLTAGTDAATWGPDAASPTPVDPVALAGLFPDADRGERPTTLVAPSFEPHVPWWENRRIQAAIGIGAALVLIAGGLFVAMRGNSSSGDEDLTTDTLPEAVGRNEDAAITTSTAAAGPTPSGLPAPPDATTGKTGSTVKSSTPTTKKPGTTVPPGKPGTGGGTSGGTATTATTTPDTTPDTSPGTTPTTEAPVDANVQWGRDMANRTSIFPGWQGIWQIGNGAPSNAFLSATFDEPARRLTVNIHVEGADQYDLRFDVSVVPGTPTTTPGTNYGTVTATLDGNRDLNLDGTQIPGTSVNRSRIAGPLTTSQVRLSVTGDSDGFDPIDFGVFDFA